MRSTRHPLDVALDGIGNLFISSFSNVVRNVDAATGLITTVACTGEIGVFSGDGGLATESALNEPVDVFVDSTGNLFFTGNGGRIRKVDAVTGILTTVAGIGENGFSGDGAPATEGALNTPGGVAVDGAGNLYISDSQNSRIRAVRGPIP